MFQNVLKCFWIEAGTGFSEQLATMSENNVRTRDNLLEIDYSLLSGNTFNPGNLKKPLSHPVF